MGKLVIDNVDYGTGEVAKIAYVSERTVGDQFGKPIAKDYLRTAAYLPIDGITELEEQPNAGFHNSFFRGKDITDRFDDGSLWDDITDGSFTNLFVGDYIKKNIYSQLTTFRIAGFDIYLHNGDTELKDHHIVLVPDEALSSNNMNATDITTGGYVGCRLHKDNMIIQEESEFNTLFGSHLVENRELLVSAVSDTNPNASCPIITGAANNWTWTSVKLALMTEVEVVGSTLKGSSGYDVGTGKSQMPLFQLAPEFIHMKTSRNCPNEIGYWLRTIASSSQFLIVSPSDRIEVCRASSSRGIRPRLLLKGNPVEA